MPTRSRDWNERVAKELRDLKYARNFVLGLLEDGDDLQEALSRFVRLFGVKEYAALAKLEQSALQRALNPKHNPTKDTLEKILAPLKLHLSAKPAA